MKVKLSELKPNPFKRQISKGDLNREQIDKIKANIKELGFFGSLPVFKKDDNYYLIAGHHRLQALRETYGKDFEVKVEVENYNEDQVFRGMVIENLTQRGRDFDETSENIQAVEDYLKEHPDIFNQLRTQSNRGDSPRLKGGKFEFEISANDVAEWIDKNTGKVLEKDVVIDYMNINHKLHPDLKKQVEKKHDKNSEERSEGIGFTKAVLLSRIDDTKEQKEVAKILENTREQRVREQGKLVTQYKDAPEEVKEKIKKGSVDIADISLALTQHNIKQKKGEPRAENIEKKINNLIDRLSYSISDSETHIKGVIKDIALLSPFVNDMNEKQKARIGMKLSNFGKLLSQISELMEKIEDKI